MRCHDCLLSKYSQQHSGPHTAQSQS